MRVYYLSESAISSYCVLCSSCSRFCCSLGKNEEPEESEEGEQSGGFVSWRFTTLTKLSIDVSGVVSHKLSRTAFHRLIKL